MMFWTACTSVYILAGLSRARYQAMRKQMIGINICDMRQPLSEILVLALLAFFWAVMPILGWSHYKLEGLDTSCSVAWDDKSLNAFSYNVSIFVGVFVIPLVSIIDSNSKLVWIVKIWLNSYPTLMGSKLTQ